MISFERANDLLAYDPVSGDLIWRVRSPSLMSSRKVCCAFNARCAGKRAGTKRRDGYSVIWIDGQLCYAHHLALLLSTGEWPPLVVDHVNGDRTDNSAANLRSVDAADNARNRALPRNNRSGVLGVHRHSDGKKWAAQITEKGKAIHLGLFSSLEEASKAREQAKARYGYHQNHGRNAGLATAEAVE